MTNDIESRPQPEVSRPALSRRLPRLGSELVVVFLGVWGALLADNWRDQRQEQERAVRIAEAIVLELDTVLVILGHSLCRLSVHRVG